MYVNVIVPLSLPTPTLTYFCDDVVSVGCRVIVQVGSAGRIVTGVVFSIVDDVDEDIKPKLRDVVEVLDRIPLVPQVTLDFWVWVSQYYMTPLGDVLRTQMAPVLSSKFHMRSTIKRMSWRVKPAIAIPEPLPFEFDDTISNSLIIERSNLELESLVEYIMDKYHHHDQGMTLVLAPTSTTATNVAQQLSRWWSVEHYNASTTLQRRGELFCSVGVGITPNIVVGTKGALSLPAFKWDAIIVLDAHNGAYKSEYDPLILVRDAALYLAHLHNAKCYMVSHTPNIEMYHNALANNWNIVHTPQNETKLNSIVLERGKELVSQYLQNQIEEVINSGRRAVIFQNRRGYASWVECPSCEHIPFCVNCTAPLAYHLSKGLLKCHHCNYSIAFDGKCSECGKAVEPYGRGTERLQERIAELFPKAKIDRVDSDSINLHKTKIDDAANIIIGTQMIFNDRLKIDNVGLMAIANADNIFNVMDFRSNENRFALIKEFADRCREYDAELIIQSSTLDDAVIKAALNDDFISFYNAEIVDRQASLYPPFSRLISINLSSRFEPLVFTIGSEVEAVLRPVFGERLSPLFQPTVGKVGGSNLVQLLLRIERSRSASGAKQTLLELVTPIAQKYRNSATINYNVDPVF